MRSPLTDHACTHFNNKALVCGGTTVSHLRHKRNNQKPSQDGTNYKRTCDTFDGRYWTPAPAMNTARGDFGLMYFEGVYTPSLCLHRMINPAGRLYAFGGYLSYNTSATATVEYMSKSSSS